jgi:hypothetical protein
MRCHLDQKLLRVQHQPVALGAHLADKGQVDDVLVVDRTLQTPPCTALNAICGPMTVSVTGIAFIPAGRGSGGYRPWREKRERFFRGHNAALIQPDMDG